MNDVRPFEWFVAVYCAVLSIVAFVLLAVEVLPAHLRRVRGSRAVTAIRPAAASSSSPRTAPG